MAKEKKTKSKAAIPSKRLKACFASGGITGLFPLLKDWPVRELKALLRDVEAFYSDTTKILDAKSKEFSGLLESAVDHGVLIKALGSAQTNFAGGQGFYNFLTFIAPYFESRTYAEIVQLMQMFVYEMTQMMVARGGQLVFSSATTS